MRDVYYINDLEQLRVFSDPFRVKILWSFYGREKTGKMLADELHIAPSKVRYHLTELERVGLIKVVRTELKNGIQQKFYYPVADNFSLEKIAHLLNGEQLPQLDDALKESVLHAMEEMREKLADTELNKHQLIEIPYSVRLTKSEKETLIDKILDIYAFLQQANRRDTDRETEEYYLNITMFPTIERGKKN